MRGMDVDLQGETRVRFKRRSEPAPVNGERSESGW